MSLALLQLLLVLCLGSVPIPILGYGPYGQETIRGVNLGGWLVLEKWITPQVFAGLPDSVKDEYTLCEYLGYGGAEQVLRAHWDSWVTEQDIIDLKNAGINHLRIPIGYWAWDIQSGEPWVSGSWDYVVKACGWAKTYGLRVMIDLHGAPGSQNGNDHSGQSGSIGFFYSDENIDRAVEVMGKIGEWANDPAWRNTVSIIEVLNEPVLWGNDYSYRLERLKTYYRRAYDAVRQHNDIAVVCVHDAFIDWSNWYYLRDDAHYWWVMLDTHLYQVWGDDWTGLTCDQHVSATCRFLNPLQQANSKLWTVVGEWSLATPSTCSNQAAFAKQQIGVYESGSGWFMWNFKNGQGWREWSFLDSQNAGWINLQQSNNVQC